MKPRCIEYSMFSGVVLMNKTLSMRAFFLCANFLFQPRVFVRDLVQKMFQNILKSPAGGFWYSGRRVWIRCVREGGFVNCWCNLYTMFYPHIREYIHDISYRIVVPLKVAQKLLPLGKLLKNCRPSDASGSSIFIVASLLKNWLLRELDAVRTELMQISDYSWFAVVRTW